MCVAYPVRVVRVPGDGTAEVDTPRGPTRVALFAIDGAGLAVGDWLLAHSGIAVAHLDAQDAGRLRELLDQANGGQQ